MRTIMTKRLRTLIANTLIVAAKPRLTSNGIGRTCAGRPASRTRASQRASAACVQPHSAGFTLLELMVVIVIIGLLSTVVVLNVLPSRDQALVEKARADIALIEQALDLYRLDNLTYPSAADGLAALLAPPAGLADPRRYRTGGYVRRLPDDPWGNSYQYANPGSRAAIEIYSLGADGQPGGEDDNADIGNW
jgi:general secretion pathway protein G